MAPGVAWVMRAVLMIPVDSPASSANSSSVCCDAAATILPERSSALIAPATLSTPSMVFTPVIMALMVGAESETCWLTE